MTTVPASLKGTYLVTGARGFMGSACVEWLLAQGCTVHALVRGSVPESGFWNHPSLRVMKGDLGDPDSLLQAVRGCQGVFHLASYVDLWAKDPGIFYRVNVGGTENLVRVCQTAGVKRIVAASTAGVLGPSPGDGSLIDEDVIREGPFMNDYECSKFVMEERLLRHAQPEMVIVLPSRVFGPGLLEKSNGYTVALRDFWNGRIRWVPGTGGEVGNYGFLPDLIEGLWLAMEKGRPGQRYILGGENIRFDEFFRIAGEVHGGRKGVNFFPPVLLTAAAHLLMQWTHLSGRRPVVTPEYTQRFRNSYRLNVDKSRRELGMPVTPFRDAVEKCAGWMKETGAIR